MNTSATLNMPKIYSNSRKPSGFEPHFYLYARKTASKFLNLKEGALNTKEKFNYAIVEMGGGVIFMRSSSVFVHRWPS